MLLEVFLMCALMTNGTATDCDEIWTVLIFDDINIDWICRPDTERDTFWVRGCSVWTNDRGYYMLLSNNGTSQNNEGESTFNHEVRHLWCLCHFHDDPPEPPRR